MDLKKKKATKEFNLLSVLRALQESQLDAELASVSVTEERLPGAQLVYSTGGLKRCLVCVEPGLEGLGEKRFP